MICTYCKDHADTLDHVIPVSFTSTSRKNAKYNRKNTVPACRECNSLLSNFLIHTVGGRAEYLTNKYKSRYRKLLKTPEWSEEDLKSLKANLRKTIEQSLIIKKSVEIRIKNCELTRDIAPTIEQVWEEIDEKMGNILE